MKSLDSSWILLLAALVIIGGYYTDETLLKVAVISYKVLGTVLFIGLLGIISFAYNSAAMLDLMNTLIKTGGHRKAAIEKFSNTRFMSIPIFLHICAGGFFICQIQDTYLSMSFIFVLLYQRILYFIIGMVTVRHLKYLDSLDSLDNLDK